MTSSFVIFGIPYNYLDKLSKVKGSAIWKKGAVSSGGDRTVCAHTPDCQHQRVAAVAEHQQFQLHANEEHPLWLVV